MLIVAVVAAVLALVAAYLAYNHANLAQRQVTALQSELAGLRTELSETRVSLGGRLDQLAKSAMRPADAPRFTPSMTIAEAIELHPAVGDILSQFHLGGCSNCAVSDVDTLEGACRSYGIDQDALIAALNGLLKGESGGSSKPIDIAKMRVRVS